MCTLSFIPSTNTTEALITINRDESPARNAVELIKRKAANGEVIWYPAEPIFGGSNLVVEASGNVSCLLNGAFLPHNYAPPYKKSRGILLLEFVENKLQKDFFNLTSLEKVEPFTLVNINADLIQEYRWDGESIYQRSFPSDKPHLWASAQMYNLQNRQERNRRFQKLLTEYSQPTSKNLLNLHLSSFAGGTGFRTELGGIVQTVSVTNVRLDKSPVIIHHDLINDHIFNMILD